MKLYKLETKIGTYWVIAEHPTQAEQKLAHTLNENDYGFSNDRKVISITHIADAVTDSFMTGKHLIL